MVKPYHTNPAHGVMAFLCSSHAGCCCSGTNWPLPLCPRPRLACKGTMTRWALLEGQAAPAEGKPAASAFWRLYITTASRSNATAIVWARQVSMPSDGAPACASSHELVLSGGTAHRAQGPCQSPCSTAATDVPVHEAWLCRQQMPRLPAEVCASSEGSATYTNTSIASAVKTPSILERTVL